MSLSLTEIDEIGSRLGYNRALTEEVIEPAVANLTPYRRDGVRETLADLTHLESRIRGFYRGEGGKSASSTEVSNWRFQAGRLTLQLAQQIGGVSILASQYLARSQGGQGPWKPNGL